MFGALPGGKERILATADELEKLRWTIKRDLACGGGLLVLEFEAIPGTHSPQLGSQLQMDARRQPHFLFLYPMLQQILSGIRKHLRKQFPDCYSTTVNIIFNKL